MDHTGHPIPFALSLSKGANSELKFCRCGKKPYLFKKSEIRR